MLFRSPFAGMRTSFAVEQTWVNGRLAYDSRRPDPFTGDQTALAVRFSPL